MAYHKISKFGHNMCDSSSDLSLLHRSKILVQVSRSVKVVDILRDGLKSRDVTETVRQERQLSFTCSLSVHKLRYKFKDTDLPLGEWSGLLSYSIEYWPGIHSWRYRSDATHSGSIDRAASCGGHMCRMRGGGVEVVSAMARGRGRGSTRRRLCSVCASVESASSLTPQHRCD